MPPAQKTRSPGRETRRRSARPTYRHTAPVNTKDPVARARDRKAISSSHIQTYSTCQHKRPGRQGERQEGDKLVPHTDRENLSTPNTPVTRTRVRTMLSSSHMQHLSTQKTSDKKAISSSHIQTWSIRQHKRHGGQDERQEADRLAPHTDFMTAPVNTVSSGPGR